MSRTAQVLDLNRNILNEYDTYAPDLIEIGLTVDAETLGQLVKIHNRTVRDLASRGIFKKLANDRYDLNESLQNYASHLREMAAGRGDEQHQLFLTSERARLAKEQADAQALKNAALRKELVSASEVEKEWANILRSIRSKFLAIPSRLRQSIGHLTAADAEIIDREVRIALEELANEQ